MRKPRFELSSGLLALLLPLAVLLSPPALADLMINPTRIVFDKNQRAGQIDVINDGTTPATYRLSIVNRRMTESGEFVAITAPENGEQFAGSMLVFSPRQIVLQPGAQQLVRIALRKPADLPPGEYRSHLSFEKIADPTLSNSVESQVKPGSTELGVSVTALIGVSIPVIVRQGQTEASVSVSSITLEKAGAAGQPSAIALQLNRTGNRSVYGDLVAMFKPANGAERLVAQAGGVAVYHPNGLRKIRLALPATAGNLSGGTLQITYKERADDGGKTIAENAIRIP